MSRAGEPGAAPPGPAGQATALQRIETSGGGLPARREFDLDTVELDETGSPRGASTTLWLLLALILVTLTWASISHVDRIVVAPGKLITTKANVVVQPIETSIVRSIEVAAGQVVRAGQLLARLDPTFSASDLEQLRGRARVLDARIARLTAELAAKPYRPSGRLTEAERLETRMFHQRRASLETRLESLAQAKSKAEAELVTTTAELPMMEQRLATMREIEGMREELFARSSGSRLNLLVSVNERLGVQASVTRMRGRIVELRHAAQKAAAEHDEFKEEFRRQTLDELIKAREDRSTIGEQIKKAELRQQLVELRPPVDAVVLEVAKRSVGSVLREAEPLMTLVPLDAPLEAEVSVSARDIGQVATGQTVRIKFDTFPFQQHGTASGIIRTISRDAFPAEQDPQAAPGTREAHYRARISIVQLALRQVPAGFRPLPGMTVSCEIKVGDRTIISYFLYPIMRGLDESIREP